MRTMPHTWPGPSLFVWTNERCTRALRRIESRWLGPNQYTGRFRLRGARGPDRELRAALAEFDRTQPLAGVPGLLEARWVLSEQGPPRLLFAVRCYGNVLDVLEELAEQPQTVFDTILGHCASYPGRGDHRRWLAFLRKHRVGGPARGGNGVPYDPAAESALPPTSFERLLDREGELLQLSMHLHRARARRDARARRRAGKRPIGLRGVHAKHHGMLRAQLRVRDDLSPEFRHGFLVPGATYDAWMRPSNADPVPRADWLPDAHGLAIKLLGVEGRGLLDLSIPDGIPVPAGRTQDFALVDHPTFFLRDARDYLLLRSLLDARPDGVREWLELAASASVYGSRRVRELFILSRTLIGWCSHPLKVEYHSLVAFLLGPELAVKWSVRPTPATRRRLSEPPWRWCRGFIAAPGDYLKAALQRSLDAAGARPLEFEVALHVPGEQQSLPVEDPTVDWGKRGARRIVVATLRVTSQDATSPERMASAENMVITPWHALADHRPLGSLNRARLGAYLASSQERRRVNDVGADEESTAEARAPFRGARAR